MGRRVVVRALLDTHTFLWWIAESGRLSGKAHSAIAYESNDIIVSAATSWEIATKYRLGKLPGGEAVATDISGHIVGQGFEEIAISVAGAERVGRLPRSPSRLLQPDAYRAGASAKSDGAVGRRGVRPLRCQPTMVTTMSARRGRDEWPDR